MTKTSRFQKGQLVAVRDGAPNCIDWHLRQYVVFDREHKRHFATLIGGKSRPFSWNECVPAEEIWPDIFIGWERRAREQDDRAVEMESKLAKRLKRQIRWLCRSLAERTHVALDCPQDMDCSFIEADCSRCWEEASFKAVKENDHA